MTTEDQTIIRNGNKASIKRPSQYFTGSVRIDSSFQQEAPGRTGGAIVTFEPSARSHWHTHPRGQILVVLTGTG
jgi:quercetin dioxygenase-like cupin family protein